MKVALMKREKPLRKLFAAIIGAFEALNASFFSPVIVLLEGRQTERGKTLKIGGEND